MNPNTAGITPRSGRDGAGGRSRGAHAAPPSLRSKIKKTVAGIAAAAVAFTGLAAGLAPGAMAAGGAGGSGGSGGSPSGSPGANSWFFDGASRNPDNTLNFPQGVGQASIDDFISESRLLTFGPGAGSPAIVANARATIQRDCTTALQTASQRGGYGNDISRSRVVGFIWAESSSGFVGTPLPNVNGDRFHLQLADWQRRGYPGLINASSPAVSPQVASQIMQLGTDMTNAISGNKTFVCIALNDLEPPIEEIVQDYDLSMSTEILGGFPQAGTTGPITERITTSNNGSSIVENINGMATLSWGGYPNSNITQRDQSKSFTMSNNGTHDVQFLPADFGWASWPGGKFWNSSSFAQQGGMATGPISHGGPDIASQMFEATPPSPTKHLTDPVDGRDLGDAPQVASGTTINANIRMEASGASVVHIKDILSDARVWIGGATSDDVNGVYVLDPNGNRMTSGVTVTIGADKSTIARVETGSPLVGTYTLVVPTTPWPEATDYTFADRGEACYGANPGDNCLTTDPKNPGKVTPDPNKVWVLDEEGGLSAADPDGTNDQGVDNKVFVPGDSVSAVVNGSIKANLAIELSGYTISDDWTNAAPYVDFSDAANNAKVFLDGVNVTSQFDIATTGTVTTATAKAGSPFLRESAGRATDAVVKLIIKGEIKAIDTNGEEEFFTNSGGESWNNDPRETNIPGIFVRTPNPDKVWVLDEEGALSIGDPDWTNDQGADNKVFLHADKVGAVVNGTLPRNLATNLSNYQIRDDWTDAAKYVDFSDASLVKVFVNGADRTADFDISIDGTVTTATAKASFLATTGNQPNDRNVKLFIFGAFKQLTEETDTQGEVIRLTNAGSETWNNDTKPTNEPPVFIWNPDPQKDVLGSASQGGDQGSINGQMVFPGQIIEYQVDLDLRIPAETAYDITNFQVEDNYSEFFTPNKASLEIYDARTNKAIPRTNWTVQWNDAIQQFVVTFSPEWVQEFVDSDNPGWLIMRFDGRIKDTTPPGSVAENIAYEILNESRTPTPIPVVSVPPTEPAKEDLRCDVLDDGSYANCSDIDGKYVLMGDYLDYRLTLDARPAADQIAYDVHKLGLIDEYDGDYLSVNESDVRVVNSVTGEDVTDKFNVQVNADEAHNPDRFSHASTDSGATDVEGAAGEGAASGKGVVYVFAKGHGYVSPITGEQVGPTEAEFEAYNNDLDLADYAVANIDPLGDAIIDQELLGSVYKVYLRTKVTQETDGYSIRNEAFQNFENMVIRTRIVANPQKVIDPAKDVSILVDGPSVDGGEIALSKQWEPDDAEHRSYFNYLLKSSEIPADRAYESRNWNIVDDYEQSHDRYTGQWVVQASTDLFDAEGELLAAKGEKIADSEGFVLGAGTVTTLPEGKLPVLGQSSEGSEEGTLVASASGVILEAKDGKWVTAAQQGFGGLFTVADADGVLTVTATQAYLDLVNLNLDKAAGWQVYVQFERIAPGTIHNTFVETYNDVPRDPNEVVTTTPQNPAISLVKFDVASGIVEGDRNEIEQALWVEQGRPTPIGFLITNTGDVPLQATKLVDETINDTLGAVDMSNVTYSVTMDGYILHPGDTITAFATLSGLTAQQLEDGSWLDTHTNLATVTAESVFPNEDGTHPQVSDTDPWNGRVESLAIDLVKFDRASGLEIGDRNLPAEALVSVEGAEPIIDFIGTNKSNVALDNITFTDTTIGGSGTVEDITFASEQGEIRLGTAEDTVTVPVLDAEGEPVLTEDGEPVVETTSFEGILVLVAQDGSLSALTLAPGESYTASGVLKGLVAGQSHTDNATTSGTSVNTGAKVDDEDPWNGRVERLELDIVKYDKASGIEAGDRNEPTDALTVVALANDTIVEFLVGNNGDSPMTDLVFTDTTTDGTGTVEDITFSSEQGEVRIGIAGETVPQAKLDENRVPVLNEDGTPVLEDVSVEGILVLVAQDGSLSKLVLAPAETLLASGTLRGVEAGTVHTDLGSITGKSVYTGQEASDEDPWNARTETAPEPTPGPTPTPSKPGTPGTPGKPGKGVVTGLAEGDTNPLLIVGGIALLLGAAAGTTYAVKKRREALAAGVAGE